MTPAQRLNPAYRQETAPSRYRTWDPNIEELALPPATRQPDLCTMRDMKQLTYKTNTGVTVDERPIIIDYESRSSGRVQRIMKWADDYIPGHESKKGCCLRFEVKVIKPGPRSTHHIGDVVIWSQTFNDVMANPSIQEALAANRVYAAELRATLIRDGFEELSKTL